MNQQTPTDKTTKTTELPAQLSLLRSFLHTEHCTSEHFRMIWRHTSQNSIECIRWKGRNWKDREVPLGENDSRTRTMVVQPGLKDAAFPDFAQNVASGERRFEPSEWSTFSVKLRPGQRNRAAAITNMDISIEDAHKAVSKIYDMSLDETERMLSSPYPGERQRLLVSIAQAHCDYPLTQD